jgi:hypothetical protein
MRKGAISGIDICLGPVINCASIFGTCIKTRSGEEFICFERARPGTLWVPRHQLSKKGNWALQAAELLIRSCKKCQGTTSVVPKVQQNQRGL